MAQYLQDRLLTEEEFREITIDKELTSEPGEIDQTTPKRYPRQFGYLSSRPGKSKNFFAMDYPNREALESRTRLLIRNLLSSADTDLALESAPDSFGARNPAGMIEEFNKPLTSFPYDNYSAAKRAAYE
ncbi:MAG: hypothetical protein LBR11_03650 [Deltaproteobacteria bacterium]|nr:hypothetical protein [Deltaproteobacteria bacterium]